MQMKWVSSMSRRFENPLWNKWNSYVILFVFFSENFHWMGRFLLRLSSFVYLLKTSCEDNIFWFEISISAARLVSRVFNWLQCTTNRSALVSMSRRWRCTEVTNTFVWLAFEKIDSWWDFSKVIMKWIYSSREAPHYN